MALVRWKPWQEIDKLFEHFPSLNGHSSDLATDIYEKDSNVIVKMHVPGIDAEQIHLKVEHTHLHISGSREEKKETKDEHYYHREIRYGSFERVVQLPCRVTQKDVKAEIKDGILIITLPKEEKGEAQKITVVKK